MNRENLVKNILDLTKIPGVSSREEKVTAAIEYKPVVSGKPAYGYKAVHVKVEPAFAQVSKIIIRDKDFDRTPAMKILRYHKCN